MGKQNFILLRFKGKNRSVKCGELLKTRAIYIDSGGWLSWTKYQRNKKIHTKIISLSHIYTYISKFPTSLLKHGYSLVSVLTCVYLQTQIHVVAIMIFMLNGVVLVFLYAVMVKTPVQHNIIRILWMSNRHYEAWNILMNCGFPFGFTLPTFSISIYFSRKFGCGIVGVSRSQSDHLHARFSAPKTDVRGERHRTNISATTTHKKRQFQEKKRCYVLIPLSFFFYLECHSSKMPFASELLCCKRFSFGNSLWLIFFTHTHGIYYIYYIYIETHIFIYANTKHFWIWYAWEWVNVLTPFPKKFEFWCAWFWWRL